jgi:hypothetical protein
MRSLWMGIMPGLEFTRVVVQDDWDQLLLKARLPHSLRDPRAVETLCQAMVRWCGRKVCAALVVDGPGALCVTRPWRDTVGRLTRHELFEVHPVSRGRPAEERDRLDGLHDYDELRWSVFFGKAR